VEGETEETNITQNYLCELFRKQSLHKSDLFLLMSISRYEGLIHVIIYIGKRMFAFGGIVRDMIVYATKSRPAVEKRRDWLSCN